MITSSNKKIVSENLETIMMDSLIYRSSDAIFFKDRDSNFIRVNDAFLNHVGISRSSEVEGRSDFDLFALEHAQAARNDELHIMETGEVQQDKLEHEQMKDGHVNWVLTTKMPLKDEAGEIIGTWGISRDITAQKEAELALEAANSKLVDASRRAGMAEVAIDILHNIGNVLNSINISTLNSMRMAGISNHRKVLKIADLLEANAEEVFFLTEDERGRQIVPYLRMLSGHMDKKQEALVQELGGLEKHLKHIKAVLMTQQDYAKNTTVFESLLVSDIIADAVHIKRGAFPRHTFKLERNVVDEPQIVTDKHRLLQIVVNLVQNAKSACDAYPQNQKTIRLGSKRILGDQIQMWVEDNGVGIEPENLPKIFRHGFTTRSDGHGFGLHSCANLAAELSGTISVESAGHGQGSKFILTLPINILKK